MKIYSLYVTQSAVINLFDVPLEVKEDIREAYNVIFRNKKCFADAFEKFGEIGQEDVSDDDLPFIYNMGKLCFNDSSAALLDSGTYNQTTFGCDDGLEDQRMNFLSFALCKSFKMLAQYRGKTVASGKIFLHLYPTGYIVVHLAVYRREADGFEIKTEEDLLELIHETKPWLNGKWVWESKFGCYSLGETFRQVFQYISMSILSEGELKIPKLKWKAGIAMTTDLSDKKVRQAIMEAKGIERAYVEASHQKNDEGIPGGILVAKDKYYYFASCRRNRRFILHSFWKINYINEFLLYKDKVYSDYLERIQKDRNEMRNLRLNKQYSFKLANIVGKDFYNDTFFPYTQLLDEYTKMLIPRYRAIYTLLSKANGFDNKRDKLKQALEDWLKDIDEWNKKGTGLEKIVAVLRNVSNFLKPFS